ncbi:hypothetical protein PIB30_034066 [Stylosanthes scabra]|uniref:TF-B3 domain-containing protein n=1 Tax=Stylosanthes scabra TaxID=79078 RepID=A0ABU6ZB72_9FABA|nr:hypothetical protein [Stylosanthes scabra]
MASTASQQNNHSPSTVIRFFKIILQKSLQDGTLKVPKKFSKKYGGGVPNPVYLKPPDGTEWRIDWTKKDGEILFEKGWKELAKYYSLDNGHLLWFEYNGTSKIEVHIFDMSGLEIDYPSNDNSVGISKKQQRQKKKVKAAPKPSSPSRSKRLKRTAKTTDEKGSPDTQNWKQNANSKEEGSPDTQNWKQNANSKEDSQSEETELEMPTRRRKRKCLVVFSPGTKGFQALVEARKFKSLNPSFILKITKANTSRSPVATIPYAFFRKYFKKKEPNVKIQFENKLWPTKLLYYPSSPKACMSSGWKPFILASNLKAGDVCVFELIKVEERVLDVHIYRAHG